MKPFRRSPCAVCGRFLIEHHSDLKDVRCDEHKDWKRPDQPPPAPPPMRDGRGRPVPPRGYGKEHCVMCHKPNDQDGDPKPGFCRTCQYRMVTGTNRQPPEPPPTVEYRQVGHFKYSAGLLLYTFLVLMAGFLIGFAVRL